jgi:predicted N-acetyltransferase YhbS
LSDDARICVRPEEPDDVARVCELTEAAFGRPAEAKLNDDLRREVSPLVSLVATRGSESGPVAGHSMWSPVEVRGEAHAPGGYSSRAFALGPISVWPDDQHHGIGGELIRAGLDACRELGELVVFVLGHPTYYPRFGWREAHDRDLWYGARPGPNPAFMVIELADGALAGRKGEVVYSEPFQRIGG